MSDTVTIRFDSKGPQTPSGQYDVPRQLGHVRLIEEIGQGGMGVVWRGQDDFLKREVAVKLMRHSAMGDPEFRNQFVEGARAAAAVKHPNVVSVFHADQVTQLVYIVMEYVDGGTLHELISQERILDPPLAALVIAKITDALTAIHEAQVIHRDLKPANVMFDSRGELLVSDFGLSHHAGSKAPDDTSTRGTPPYMAPELFGGEASFQSDIYALGMILYELLTGRRAFPGPGIEDYHRQHLDFPLPEEPLHRADVDEQVRELIRRATHKQRMFRYKEAFHLRKALLQCYPRITKDENLERRLRQLALKLASGSGNRDQQAEPTSQAETYFDLLTQRAEAKRRKKRESQ